MEITLEQFFEAVAQYNQMLYPAQWGAMLLAMLAVVYAIVHKPFSDPLIIGVGIFLYLMNALAFWLPAAMLGYAEGYIYVGMFVLESLFLLSAALEDDLHFRFESTPLQIIGWFVAGYALLAYPLVAILIGRAYPGIMFSPLFPSALNIWMVGMFLMTDKPVPRYTMIIPFIWGLIGIMWVSMGITEDIALVIINLIGPAILVYRDRDKRMGLHY